MAYMLKASMCEFIKKEVQYLGHIVSGEGSAGSGAMSDEKQETGSFLGSLQYSPLII